MGAQGEMVEEPTVGTSPSSLGHPQPASSPPTSTMRCSGSRNCGCTIFKRTKSSEWCKNCSHHNNNHTSSDSDSEDSASNNDGDDDDGHNDTGKLPSNARSKKNVSSLISDLIRGGEYAGGEVRSAQNEAKAGLTKKHVRQLIQLTI
jgi:hypothetical protein